MFGKDKGMVWLGEQGIECKHLFFIGVATFYASIHGIWQRRICGYFESQASVYEHLDAGVDWMTHMTWILAT